MAHQDPYRSQNTPLPGYGSGRRASDTSSAVRAASAGRPGRDENLALLYQAFLTGIVRIQSGRQQIMDNAAFRKRMKESLHEVEREAVKRGYSNEDITEATFAIVAFLDEAVLTSNDPARMEWAKQSLQEELFGQSVAGEMFFERLDRIRARRDSPPLADVMEVYYLCLLLGYEGRYAVGGKAELRMLMDNLRERIEHIRGRSEALSPEGHLPAEPVRAPGVDLTAKKLRIFALASLALTVLSFAAFGTYLYFAKEQVRVQVQQRLVP